MNPPTVVVVVLMVMGIMGGHDKGWASGLGGEEGAEGRVLAILPPLKKEKRFSC